MKNSLQQKGFALALISSFAALALAFVGAGIFEPAKAASLITKNKPSVPGQSTLAHQGRTLFLQNCAHCHGEDASGDEGPDLHGVKKTDERIARIITNGIKGEMPKFGAKFSDTDVRALTAYIRSLVPSMGFSPSESAATLRPNKP